MAGDTANDLLIAIAQQVITPVVNAIGRQFGYVFCYKSNINNLESKVKQLEESRDDAESLFIARSGNNEERSQSSTGWLKNVETVTKVAKEVVEAKDKSKGWCLNLKDRYVLSRKSTKLAATIQELQDQALTNVATNPALPAAKLHGALSNDASKDFKTRTEIMDKVMKSLKNDSINITGICGLGGIGKTTILHEVRERAIKEKLFVEVAMTTVSNDPNMFNIQSDLASMLGLTNMEKERNNIARADMLHKRLTNGSTILVILDDVWSAIELKEIGIPVGNDRAKCKVILASRYKNVCTSMGTLEPISVEELPEEEAWLLFKKKAGDCVEKEKLEEIAKEVAGKCGGLPIALVTLAKALSNKKREVWEDALRQLKQACVTSIHGMNKNVYSSLRLSYDFLKGELPEAQLLLLICCQHPEDAVIEVEKLARYCLALKLFQNVDKVLDARNRTYTVIDHLKSCFLLQEVDVGEKEKDPKYETVKMHVIVRDVCLSIVSEMKVERDKVYMHIMAPDTDGGYELGTGKVDYPKLMLFKAPLNGKLLDITFLEQMEGLRVFENVRRDEDHPPPAFQVLKNLRMLSLEHKSLSEELMSTIGSLSSLEILSFWCSRISSIPRQIGQLTNLKLLDLRCEEGRGFIPSGMLSGMKQLEVLCMGNFILSGLRDKDIENGENHGRITELDSLSNLTTLQINLVDPNDLLDLQCFRFENLESFYLGSYKFDYGDIGYKYRSRPGKTINLGKIVGMKWALEAKIEGIVKSTMNLELEDIEDWTDPLVLEKFVSLSKLVLKNCKQLEYVIPGGSLEELRWLVLDGMPMMRHLWVGPFDPLCFGNLIEIHIDRCPAIECVFPYSAAKSLVQLQKLFIHDCLKLEGIVSKGELGITTTSREPEIKEENPNDFISMFPKLRILDVRRLPKLGGFYNHKFDDVTTQQPFLNPLIVGGGMLELSKLATSHWLQNLEEVYIVNCHSLETVFNFEGLQVMGENAHVQILGQLKSLRLMLLQNLEHLCRKIPQGIHVFQNLQRLSVDNCFNLGYLISSTMAHMLVNLKFLTVWGANSLKEVVEMNEDHYALKKIVFRSLRIVILRHCGELLSFCSSKQQSFEFPSLEEVCIYNCPKIKTFCSGHLTAEKLHGVKSSYRVDSLVLKGDLNETVRQLNARVDQTNSDMEEDDVPEEGIADEYGECINEDDIGSSNSTPLEQVHVIGSGSSSSSSSSSNIPHDVGSSSSIPLEQDNTGSTSSIPLEFDQMIGDLREDDEYVKFTNEDDIGSSSSTPFEQVHDIGSSSSIPHDIGSSKSIPRDFGSSNSIPLEQGTPLKASIPPSVVSSPNVSLTPVVASPSPPVSDNNEELANSLSPDLRKFALPPLTEFVPSASMEQSVHSSDSSLQPKADKELSDMPLSSRDDEKRILIQGVYVKETLKTTFEDILAAKPKFLSGLRLKTVRMKTDAVESTILSFQILCQRTPLTISSEELENIKDALDDMDTSGLDTTWLERGYKRAMLVRKEQKAVSAATNLAMLEREKTEDEAAFQMAREKMEESMARRDAFKAEYGALMQELKVEKELFGGGFDLETCLGDGLLGR